MGVRTNAPLAQFKTVLMQYSTPTYVGAQAEGPVHHLPGDIRVGEEVPAATAIKVEETELEEDKPGVTTAVFAQPCPTHCAAD